MSPRVERRGAPHRFFKIQWAQKKTLGIFTIDFCVAIGRRVNCDRSNAWVTVIRYKPFCWAASCGSGGWAQPTRLEGIVIVIWPVDERRKASSRRQLRIARSVRATLFVKSAAVDWQKGVLMDRVLPNSIKQVIMIDFVLSSLAVSSSIHRSKR